MGVGSLSVSGSEEGLEYAVGVIAGGGVSSKGGGEGDRGYGDGDQQGAEGSGDGGEFHGAGSRSVSLCLGLVAWPVVGLSGMWRQWR